MCYLGHENENLVVLRTHLGFKQCLALNKKATFACMDLFSVYQKGLRSPHHQAGSRGIREKAFWKIDLRHCVH